MNHITSTALAPLFAAALVLGACNKKEDAPKPPAAPAPGPDQPALAPPRAGTDADNKKAAAQELATKIDASLATLQHGEKDLPQDVSATAHKAEAWWSEEGGKRTPKKLVLKTVDAKGTVTETTDLYFDDRGMVEYVRAPDGFFVFHDELLALWLDREQRVRPGLNPGVTSVRVDTLKKAMMTGLDAFALR
jgi:hypothetical protein